VDQGYAFSRLEIIPASAYGMALENEGAGEAKGIANANCHHNITRPSKSRVYPEQANIEQQNRAFDACNSCEVQ